MKYENVRIDFVKHFLSASPEPSSFEGQTVVISRVSDTKTVGGDGSESVAKMPNKVEWLGGAEHISELDGADMRVYDNAEACVFSGRVSLKFGPDISRKGDVTFDVV